MVTTAGPCIAMTGTAGTVLGSPSTAAIIALACAVKRCHDRNQSGWMLLFVMPPLLGQLWMALSLVTGPGTPGPNRHGVREGVADPRRRWAASLSPRAALA